MYEGYRNVDISCLKEHKGDIPVMEQVISTDNTSVLRLIFSDQTDYLHVGDTNKLFMRELSKDEYEAEIGHVSLGDLDSL